MTVIEYKNAHALLYHLVYKRPYGPGVAGLAAGLPSGMSLTGSHRAVAVRTFGALPFACMIRALQSGELRKHSPVRLNDLSVT